MNEKKCWHCKKVKLLTEFYKHRYHKDGHNDWCKDCQNYYGKKYYQKSEVKLKGWEAHLKKSYGMTLAEYDQMLLEQDNKCAICQKELIGKFCIDHCHKTDIVSNGKLCKIRGLLCYSCNSGLGYFKDSPKIMESAINYLKR